MDIIFNDMTCHCDDIEQAVDYIVNLYDINELPLDILLDNIEIHGITIKNTVYVYAKVNKIINRYQVLRIEDDKKIDLSIKGPEIKIIFDDDKIAFS